MGTLYQKRFECGNICEVTEDFTLPDYQPEIRRIVGVSARSSVDGKYLSGDTLEVDGGVTYTVMYTGADGLIHEAAETSSYTGKIPASAADGDRFSVADIILSSVAENASCRVSAPRRITLSSRVRLSVMSEKPTEAKMSAEGEVRCRCESVPCACALEVSQASETSGEIREREGAQLTWANGEICISDVRITGERACVKGDACVSMVLRLPEGEYVNVRKSSPIEDYIPLPDYLRGGDGKVELRACVFATPLMLEVESADDGVISWKMEYDLTLDVMRCSKTEIVRDAYLTQCEDEVNMAECDAYYPAASVNGRLTTSATAKQKVGMHPVCAWGTATADKCEIAGGKMTVSGSVKVIVVMEGDGEISCEEVTFPVKYECDAYEGVRDTDDSSMQKRVALTVSDAHARSDGDTLHVTAELSVSALALGVQRIGFVREIMPLEDGAKVECADSVIRVYAPEDGESAWDVEKRFRLKSPAKMEGSVYVV